MKKMSMILAALLLGLCCSSGLADDGRACAKVMADLLDAPNAGANVMMRYYIGTRVEVVREVDAAYVQVNVGEQGGSLMGYMEKRDLAFGEEAIRQVRAEAVSYTAEVGARCRLYSYPDKLAPVSDEAFDISCKSVLGYRQGDWLHVDDGLGHTGFVARDEIVLTGPDYQYADIIYVERAEDEMTYEAAIEYGKQCLLADGEMANGQDGVPLTREMLDNCRVEVDAIYYYDSESLMYHITYIYTDRTWEDGLPMICAFVELWIEGDEVVRYGYGNG